MKNIINVFLLSLSCILFAGCSDDDNKGDVVTTLIASTENLIQPPTGGSGEIVLLTTDGVSIDSSVDWCTYTVSGNTIKFDIAYNPSSESRNAIISVRKGEDHQHISILQNGEVLDTDQERLFVRQTGKTTAGGTLQFIVRANAPFSVKANDSWIDYTIKDDSIVLVTPTTTTDNRRGSITVYLTNNPSHQKTIPLLQFTATINDFIGDWDLTYTNVNGARTTAIITMARMGSNSFVINNFPYPSSPNGLATVAGYVDFNNGNINFPITLQTGKYTAGTTALYGYLCVYDRVNDYVFGSPTPDIQLPGITEYFDSTNGISYTFPVDKEVTMGVSLDSFIIALFTKEKDKDTGVVDFESMAGYIEMYTDVVLKKR